MNIYISITTSQITNKLIKSLKKRRHKIVYVKDSEFMKYRYTGIYKLVESCDCLLGFTDQYTLSGTWRAIEMTYAHSGVGAFDKADFHIPVFLYNGLDEHESGFAISFAKRHEVYSLPNEIDLAIQFIEDTMSKFSKRKGSQP
jgi:hypothetical protein